MSKERRLGDLPKPCYAKVVVDNASGQPLQRLRMLVVDDEAGVLRALSRTLRRHHVCTAASYEEALKILEEQPIDVIVSDCIMPGRDGVELLRRAAALKPAAVRVMLTGYPPANIQSLVDHGVLHSFYLKPWNHSLTEDLERLYHAVSRR